MSISSFIETLLCDATDSLYSSPTDEEILSLALAGQFFRHALIPLSGAKCLFENCVGRSITEGRLLHLLKTPELAKICRLGTRGGELVLVASTVLGEAIAFLRSKKYENPMKVTNGTDIGDYSNKNKSTNLTTESDRIARLFNDEFTCVICMDMLEDAVESSCCKALCCSKCSEKCPTCPMCRKQNIRWTANEPIRRIAGKKPAKCSNNGCSQWSTSAEIKIHKEKCEHRTVNCTNRGCNEKMKFLELKTHISTKCKFNYQTCSLCKKQMPHGTHHPTRKCVFKCGESLCDNTASAHNDTCVFREVRCVNAKCKEMVQKQHVTHHLRYTCDYRILTCPHDKCDVSTIAKEMENHINNCPEARVPCKYCNCVCYRRNLLRHESGCKRRPRSLCDDCNEWYWDGDGHEEVCPERWIDCPNQNCKFNIRASQLNYHTNVECQFRKFQCRNPQCDKFIFRHQRQVHEDEQCPYRPAWCPYCCADRKSVV